MAQVQSRNLLEGPILGSLLTLAIPIAAANILQAAYQLNDAFWVGRLGGAAVAAVSVTTPVVFLTIAVGAGLAIAGSTLIAQYYGARNQEMVNHIAAQTLLMVVIVSAVLGTAGYIAAPSLLKLMGVAPEVYVGALGFMRMSFIGLVFNFFFFMFQSIMRGVGEARFPVLIVLGTVILNFALNPLFIFGWGPVPAMGVMGAAVATVGTQSLAAVIALIVLLRGRHGVHLAWRDFRPDLAYIKRAFFLGLPASVEQSARALGLTVLTFLITSFGTLTVAAYGVGSTILQVVMIPAMGLSMAVSTLVGQNIGAGNIERAAQIGRLGAWLGFGILTAFGVIVFALAPQLVGFFVPGDQDVIAAGTVFLRTIALSWGFLGAQLCMTGVLRASGNMVMTMMLTLMSQWVLQFPLSYVLSKHTAMGSRGIWWAFPITYTITVLVTLAVYARGDWKRKRLAEPEEELTERVTADIMAGESVRQG
ncbi:MATE family efflux transporter [Longimicrobium terrae]|uniref:Putative MATE family efflux protein n=1 Tax=Longimicrobium terrae TaxID=1639882 RepID=A0A841GXJ6_9BACT|nr:MATE family efflux transporter [Longimicrobium terrae]MBB4636074.1 putative MATE family efflux protein [Longimicrobium terrae]MBB6070469.1 putative MATE family efflux protein [Longimicrobium terrae]NNC29460.1 MATE family efflux transporter [Longimicrobium terrae]